MSVFCSSYPGDIKLGFRWSPEVQRNLQEAGTLMLVATKQSVQRNSVWFESACSGSTAQSLFVVLDSCGQTAFPLPSANANRQDLLPRGGPEASLRAAVWNHRSGCHRCHCLRFISQPTGRVGTKRPVPVRRRTGWVGVAWKGKFLGLRRTSRTTESDRIGVLSGVDERYPNGRGLQH